MQIYLSFLFAPSAALSAPAPLNICRGKPPIWSSCIQLKFLVRNFYPGSQNGKYEKCLFYELWLDVTLSLHCSLDLAPVSFSMAASSHYTANKGCDLVRAHTQQKSPHACRNVDMDTREGATYCMFVWPNHDSASSMFNYMAEIYISSTYCIFMIKSSSCSLAASMAVFHLTSVARMLGYCHCSGSFLCSPPALRISALLRRWYWIDSRGREGNLM